jgi:drug/metabolite transporter (DMT)-like permease
MSDRGKGAIAAVVAALLAAGFYIPFKAAGAANSRLVIVLAMLLCAAGLNSVTALVRGARGRAFRPVALVTAAVLGVFTVLGNFGVASALAIQEPAVTATVIHTQLLFVAVLELVFLGNPITRRFAIGAVIALAGFAVMQLAGGGVGSASTIGVLWALLASISFAVMHVFTRAVIERIDPVAVNAFRLWIAVAALLCIPGNAAGLVELDSSAWWLCFAAAFLGPFLSRLAIMASVRFIAASDATLLTMVNSLFAFVLGYAAFRTLPAGYEIAGGLIIIAGVLVPMWPTARSRAAP